MQSQPQFSQHDPSPLPPRAIPLDPLGDLRRDLLTWAEPIIADRIFEGYRDHEVDAPMRRLLSMHHRRLWRAMILDHRSLLGTLQNELHHDLQRAHVDPDVARTVDQSVMEELMDIVFKRFRSSREMAKGFSLVLLSAATSMGAAGTA